MDTEEVPSRLGELCQFLRFYVECARRVGLLQRNIDAADPCIVHPNVRHNISTFVSDCDVHGLANFLGFLLRRANDTAGIFQFHCGHDFSLCFSESLSHLLQLELYQRPACTPPSTWSTSPVT